MIYSNILVPFDGSDLAIKSLEKAIEIAKLDPAIKISVLHVVQVPLRRGVPDGIYNSVKQLIFENGNETLQAAKEIAEPISEQVELLLEEGAPIHIILEKANELNCDLIIMGSRGLSGVMEFLGSVSHYITQNSKIPVLLIK